MRVQVDPNRPASALGAEGRGFEFLRPDRQIINLVRLRKRSNTVSIREINLPRMPHDKSRPIRRDQTLAQSK
jgi:hypothetical protein